YSGYPGYSMGCTGYMPWTGGTGPMGTVSDWSAADITAVMAALKGREIAEADAVKLVNDARARKGKPADFLKTVSGLDAGVKGDAARTKIQDWIKTLKPEEEAGLRAAPATLSVQLPADARLLIDDAPTT